MSKKNVPIKYTDRDYSSIRSSLIEHAKRYYPESFRDFSEASFGSLMIDTVAYVGDILSFYLDYQTNESFLDSAIEYNNIVRLGRQMGYKFQGVSSAQGILTFYIIVPRDETHGGPDTDYCPILEKGSVFSSPDGNTYILTEPVDFKNDPTLEIVAAEEDTAGTTLSWAFRGRGQVIAGRLVSDNVSVGEFRRFFKTPIVGRNVIEVLSVIDDEGHEYYEVDHLSQNTIYVSVPNRGLNRDTAKEILKPVIVPRRFVVVKERNITMLQFGYGSEENLRSNLIADPSNMSLQLHGRNHISDTGFDPFKLTKTDKFGVGPSNTNLTVKHIITNTPNSNASVGAVNKVVTSFMSFPSELEGVNLSTRRKQAIKASLEVRNESQIIGAVSIPTGDELKIRIFDHFATQKRAVTKQDYVAMIYNMPAKFGSIKRATILQDQDSFKRNLNIHVVGEDSAGRLIELSSDHIINSNLKTWINSHRMVNDTIDILPAKILNFGIKFTLITSIGSNKTAILDSAVSLLREEFALVKMDIGENFNISEVYKTLNFLPGVADTIDVRVYTQAGGKYSDVDINVEDLIDADGRVVVVPQNVILEIKDPFRDIVGIIK